MQKKIGYRNLVLTLFLVILFDQLCKYYIYSMLSKLNFAENGSDNLSLVVTSFLNIVIVWNYGIGLGFFNNIAQNQLFFIILSLFVILMLTIWYRNVKEVKICYTLGLIIGGAISNILDRVNFGAVLDFIDFHAMGYHYPAFNVADIFIVLGACLLIFKHKL